MLSYEWNKFHSQYEIVNDFSLSNCLGHDVCLMSTDVTQSREIIEKAYMDFDGNIRRPRVNWIIKS